MIEEGRKFIKTLQTFLIKSSVLLTMPSAFAFLEDRQRADFSPFQRPGLRSSPAMCCDSSFCPREGVGRDTAGSSGVT